MFQFSPLAPFRLCIQRRVTRHDSRRVSPFGHLRINAYVRLPEAFRSLSRPSSPVHAKASTVRPCSLDRICSLRSRKSEDHTGPPSPKNTRMVLESFSRTLNPIPQPWFSNSLFAAIRPLRSLQNYQLVSRLS